MGNLYITEYSRIRNDQYNQEVQAALEPALATQNLAYSAASNSANFTPVTSFVRINTDSNVHILFGNGSATVTANTNCTRMTAGTTEYFGVIPGTKLGAIAGT